MCLFCGIGPTFKSLGIFWHTCAEHYHNRTLLQKSPIFVCLFCGKCPTKIRASGHFCKRANNRAVFCKKSVVFVCLFCEKCSTKIRASGHYVHVYVYVYVYVYMYVYVCIIVHAYTYQRLRGTRTLFSLRFLAFSLFNQS